MWYVKNGGTLGYTSVERLLREISQRGYLLRVYRGKGHKTFFIKKQHVKDYLDLLSSIYKRSRSEKVRNEIIDALVTHLSLSAFDAEQLLRGESRD